MPTFSLADLPLVFVSDASMSKPIARAVERGELRKLASRLYTRDYFQYRHGTDAEP